MEIIYLITYFDIDTGLEHEDYFDATAPTPEETLRNASKKWGMNLEFLNSRQVSPEEVVL